MGLQYQSGRFYFTLLNQYCLKVALNNIFCDYINKQTRCTFCMYLFYNFCTTLHVSKDNFVHQSGIHKFTVSAAQYKPCKRAFTWFVLSCR